MLLRTRQVCSSTVHYELLRSQALGLSFNHDRVALCFAVFDIFLVSGQDVLAVGRVDVCAIQLNNTRLERDYGASARIGVLHPHLVSSDGDIPLKGL